MMAQDHPILPALLEKLLDVREVAAASADGKPGKHRQECGQGLPTPGGSQDQRVLAFERVGQCLPLNLTQSGKLAVKPLGECGMERTK